ncbi:MAG TPA: MOSC N-terminal beta barrel domain-containing protein [Fimbriimonas sp.]
MTPFTIQSLHAYPVKSLRGVDLSTADVEAQGFRHDRRWMLVDENGQFMSQRSLARMATVGTRMVGDGIEVFQEGRESLRIPPTPQDETVRISVWSFEAKARAVGQEADAWFSDALGQACRLVALPLSRRRTIHPHYGPGEIAFADAMPILVASQASLDLLNSKLDLPVPMNRFRANLILAGTPAHAEDEWERIQIGGVTLRRTKKCGRCLVTTTDQRTGERGTEPLRTLAEYRQEGNTVYFGCYYVPETLGTVKVGEEVRRA